MSLGGLNSEYLEEFLAAAKPTQFGGSAREICGARNRRGGACQRVPIKEGRGRCLLHCGPKAAGEFRERQRQAFLSGKLSADEWRAAETRRKANRLRDRWKKTPWMSGATIDLGEYEAGFQEAMRCCAVATDDLPPAVSDWLRWRYRRIQIDRSDDVKWKRVLAEELPKRLSDIGPRPASVQELEQQFAVGPKAESVCEPGPDKRSKRVRPDLPKAPPKVQVRKQFHRGRPRKNVEMSEDEEQELARINATHHATLRPLYEKCRGPRDKLNVLRALRDYLRDPGDRSGLERWMAVINTLKPQT